LIHLYRQSDITSYVRKLSKRKLREDPVSDVMILMHINDDLNQSLREVAIRIGLITNTSFGLIYDQLTKKLSEGSLYHSENTYVDGYKFYKWTPSTYEPNYEAFIKTVYNNNLNEDDIYKV